VVKAKRFTKEIHLEYRFDRLSGSKIAQAYKILVPDKVWTTGDKDKAASQDGGRQGEDCSVVRSSVLGAAERRANHR
jgi:hypothetical protein